MRFRGRCWKFGDYIPTDQIVPSHLVYRPMSDIVRQVLATLNPEFPERVQPGDILVAGKHFGQSSGRAIAAKAIQATGVACVVAENFARTFYRNAFEIGLAVLECPGISEAVQEGDLLDVDVESGWVRNETTGRALRGEPTPPFLLEMLRAGGLIPFGPRLLERFGGGWPGRVD